MVPRRAAAVRQDAYTHDSIYDEQEAMGADCLTIRMFEQEHRIENADKVHLYRAVRA